MIESVQVEVVVPTLKELVEFLLKKSTKMDLFDCVPIGTAALVCLECLPDGSSYLLHASVDENDIECHEGAYTSWDELYLADTDAELMATAYRMITTVRDAIRTTSFS